MPTTFRMQRALTLFLVAALTVALTACGGSGGTKSKKKKGPKKPAATGESAAPLESGKEKKVKKGFYVVQVNGESRIVTGSELETIRAELKAEQKKALDGYKKAKMEAEKSGAKFDQPRPPRPKLRVSRTAFATREEAEAHQQKMSEPKATRKPKKSTRPKPPPEEKGDPEEENPEGDGAEEGNPDRN